MSLSYWPLNPWETRRAQDMRHFHRKGWGWAVLGAACPRHLVVLGLSNRLCWTITTVSSPSPNPKEGQKVFAPDLLSSKMTRRTPIPSYHPSLKVFSTNNPLWPSWLLRRTAPLKGWDRPSYLSQRITTLWIQPRSW